MTSDAYTERELTGLVASERVHDLPSRVDGGLLERLRGLPDLSATVSDVLDALGIEAAVGASDLSPTIEGSRVVGTAVTVRKVARRRSAVLDAADRQVDMGEIEGANQCGPGDVLVIEGQRGVSAMGGLMATMCKRQGASGAVIDGGVRDVGHARSIGFPVWSSDVTPLTGKWRSEVVEVNGAVTIGGKVVQAGDLVIADETGMVFVPRDLVEEVVTKVEEVGRAEEAYRSALESDIPLARLLRGRAAEATPDPGADGAGAA